MRSLMLSICWMCIIQGWPIWPHVIVLWQENKHKIHSLDSSKNGSLNHGHQQSSVLSYVFLLYGLHLFILRLLVPSTLNSFCLCSTAPYVVDQSPPAPFVVKFCLEHSYFARIQDGNLNHALCQRTSTNLQMNSVQNPYVEGLTWAETVSARES